MKYSLPFPLQTKPWIWSFHITDLHEIKIFSLTHGLATFRAIAMASSLPALSLLIRQENKTRKTKKDTLGYRHHSIACLETKSKEIAPASHNRPKQYHKPIKIKKELHAAGHQAREKRACKSRLVIVLLPIIYESGASFSGQSQRVEVQNQSKCRFHLTLKWKPLYIWHIFNT